MSERKSLYFVAPKRIEVRREPLPAPAPGEVRVEVRASLISAGTERLIYRGKAPSGQPVDRSLPAYEGESFRYPLKYGYAAVGEVTACGADVDPVWNGRRVLAWRPHESAFNAPPGELLALDSAGNRAALERHLFIPSLETALTLVHDLAPRVGERVVVTGLGLIGLLASAILHRMSLQRLVLLDPLDSRLSMARRLLEAAGDDGLVTVRTGSHEYLERARDALSTTAGPGGADAALELSGGVDGLNDAIALTGDSGRVILGSWYSGPLDGLDLNVRFHRSRITLASSQVSSLAPELTGRWNLARRRDVAASWVPRLDLDALVSQRVPIEQAADAYHLLDDPTQAPLGIVLTY